MARITENDLQLPALYVICQNGTANTTRIKNVLTEVFRPTGEDNEILAGRNDTKFTQIVRNLMGSHYETNGMRKYTTKAKDGRFSLTEEGLALVEENIDALKHLFSRQFAYEDTKAFAGTVYAAQSKKRKLIVYSEDDTITEGKAAITQSKSKERSRTLREAAIQHYTVGGRIVCAVCGFDFAEVYGPYGEGYIQIHHEKPICQYSDDGSDARIKDAVKDVKPLCANCHCMLHRRKGAPLSVVELAEMIKTQQTSRH